MRHSNESPDAKSHADENSAHHDDSLTPKVGWGRALPVALVLVAGLAFLVADWRGGETDRLLRASLLSDAASLARALVV